MMATTSDGGSWLTEALERWVGGHLRSSGIDDATGVAVAPLAKPRSGQSNETVVFTSTWRTGSAGGRLDGVARVQPTRNQMFLDPDVGREAAVLDTLGRAGVPVPRVLGTLDASFAGTPFFVMERVDGHVPFGRPSVHRDPWLVALDPADRRRLWSSAMAIVLNVHAVDPTEMRGVLGTTPADETVAADVDRARSWFAWAAKGRSFPLLEQALDRLRSWAAGTAADRPVVLWGDARLGNMIVGDDHLVAAAIDWETASIGPRTLDLGWWLMMDDYSTSAVGIERLDGFPSPAETTSIYREGSGLAAADLDEAQLLAAVKLAITLIRTGDSLVARHVIDVDSRFAHDNVPTQMVARRLGVSAPALSPDYRRLARVDG
jgi:aminoglycoside phosphotransferase (APT) family kinase protein